ncbi:hypothetical protein IV203_030667 [Nitzschia inconspicua]|uniref:Uncharacterized protein n=1 Tax=Nitzschia inconspicua TaxID=303405 RepID=A0A9K3LST5_9STRA|nr:hypothetical protein IV203_030667 [Nitzschia inconspicua]
MADPANSNTGRAPPDAKLSNPVTEEPEWIASNQSSHATSGDSTRAETIEEQLLQMASSPRGEVFLSPQRNIDSETSADIGVDAGSTEMPSGAQEAFSIQMSTVRGESVSALSGYSAVDDSGHVRSVMPITSIAAVRGPPTSIIQQTQQGDDTDSILKLDSMEEEGSERMSEVSDFQMPSGNGNNTNVLNIESSSGSSMGSQGSYAHQVPALSQSTSASNSAGESKEQKQANRTQTHLSREVDLAKGSVVLPPRSGGGLMMMNAPSVSVNSLGTSMPPDMGCHPNNSDLDDILGPKGEPVQSDLDDILGPPDGKPSDLDDTLGPYQAGGSKAPDQLPSADSGSLNYASKYLPSQQQETTFPKTFDRNSYTEQSPSVTPVGSEPGTPTNRTPSLSRQAIDHIGRALAQRDAEHNPLSPAAGTAASILPEASVIGGASTAFGTAMDHHTPRHKAGMAIPQPYDSSSKTHPRKEFFPAKVEALDSVEPTSTWESQNKWAASTSQVTSARDEVSSHGRGTLSPDNQSSYWVSSRGETTSPGVSSRGETLSPGESEVISPSSRAGHTLSPSTRATRLLSSGSSSQVESFESSRRGQSMASPAASSESGTPSRGYSTQGDAFSPTEHTRDFSFTGHTRTDNSQSMSQAESFSRSDRQFSPSTSAYSQETGRQFTYESDEGSPSTSNRRSVPDLSQSASEDTGVSGTERTRTNTTRSGILSAETSVGVSTESDGGRLWRMAEVEARNNSDRPVSPQARKFAESIMARTRSRADPDALVDNGSNMGGDAMETPSRSMIKLTTDEDVGIIESTALARKRVRVVQLLGAGLVTFLISFMGGFWIQSSCHFVSTQVEVGENGEEFSLHFGLWKYTPVDSVFQGYSYCSQYDDEFVNDGPWFGRLTSNLALIGGAFSLLVLWIYLVFGRCIHKLWKGAVITAGLSGVLQLLSLSIFAGPVCAGGCRLGPGGYVSILAGCFYLFLAHEMHYNAPLVTVVDGLLAASPSSEQPQNLMADLEMKDFKHGAKAYVRRLTLGEANPYPTLNQVHRGNGSQIGGQMMDRDCSKGRSYQPPPVFV